MDTVKKSGKVTIQGIVTAAEWDEYDDVVGVKIETLDENAYFVTDDDMGQAIMDYVQEEVEVTGSFHVDRDKNKWITIEDFSVFEDAGYDEEEGDWEDEEE